MEAQNVVWLYQVPNEWVERDTISLCVRGLYTQATAAPRNQLVAPRTNTTTIASLTTVL